MVKQRIRICYRCKINNSAKARKCKKCGFRFKPSFVTEKMRKILAILGF